jgi:hypothetical protein
VRHIRDKAAASSPVTGIMKSNSLFTRREMLELTGATGLATFGGIAPMLSRRLHKNGPVSPVLSAIGVS